MDVTVLPTLNAALNGMATICLVTGWTLIRRRRIDAHRRVMIAALACSTLFLISYVVYHAQVGSRPFTGAGPVRFIYFAILVTHVVLAVVIVPLVLVSVSRALRGQF